VKPVEIMLSPKRRKEIYKYLEKLYYDLSNAGAYTGPSKLYEIIKSRGINDIGLYTIRKWLQSQRDKKKKSNYFVWRVKFNACKNLTIILLCYSKHLNECTKSIFLNIWEIKYYQQVYVCPFSPSFQ